MSNKKLVFVQTGEVKIGDKETILKSSAIGSCVVVAIYDTKEQIGGLAHIMLPGKSSKNSKYQKTRYTDDAIEELMNKMNFNNPNVNNIEVCAIGGANVLQIENDTIGHDNIDSIFKKLKEKKCKILAKSVGGFERRSATLNVETGKLTYTIGDGVEMILWNFLDNDK